MIIWLEGADGTGKTNTACELYSMLSTAHEKVCHAYHVDCVTYKALNVMQSNFTADNPVHDAALNGILIADRCAQISWAVYTHALPHRDWSQFETPPIPYAPPAHRPHVKQLLWVNHGSYKIPQDYSYGEFFAIKRAYKALGKQSLPDKLKSYLPVVDVFFESDFYSEYPQAGVEEVKHFYLGRAEALEASVDYATGKGLYRLIKAIGSRKVKGCSIRW